MQGKIIKGIAGFYYVQTKNGVYECKAKGSFRNRKLKPFVGDHVEIAVLDEETKKGNMEEILERKNFLIRPAVANVDQTLLIFAAAKPDPNLNLLDRFLVMMEQKDIPVILVFNKKDAAKEEELGKLVETYQKCGYQVLTVSALNQEGISEIQELLRGKTTTVAGPSGVGKSSIINLLQPDVCMETGAISEKIERGKHTTRHSELIPIAEDTYIFDTPGFSSIYLADMRKEELKSYFPEFSPYEEECRFLGCVHVNEPVCGVKEALTEGKISQSRYDNYKLFYEELKENEKRKYL